MLTLDSGGNEPSRFVGLLSHGLVDDTSDEGSKGKEELEGSDEEASQSGGGDLRFISSGENTG